jgi:hypothetical protein
MWGTRNISNPNHPSLFAFEIKLSQSIPHILIEQRRVVWMPPTQRGPSLCDIGSRPHDSQLVQLFPCLMVWHQDVKVPNSYAVEHVADSLLGCPGTGWLLAKATRGHAGVGPSGARHVHALVNRLT